MRTPDEQPVDGPTPRRRGRLLRRALVLGAVAAVTVGPASAAFARPPLEAELGPEWYEPAPPQTTAQDPAPSPRAPDTEEALRIADERLQRPECRGKLTTPIGDPLQLLRTLQQKPGNSGIWDTGLPRVTAEGDPIYAEPSQNGAGANGRLLLYQAFHTPTLRDAQAEGLSSQAELRAEIILHELWHLLGAVHGDDPRVTAAFDASVKRACFPSAPVPADAAPYLDAGYTPVIVGPDNVVIDGGRGPLPSSDLPDAYDTDVTIRDEDGNVVDGGVTYDPNSGAYIDEEGSESYDYEVLPDDPNVAYDDYDDEGGYDEEYSYAEEHA